MIPGSIPCSDHADRMAGDADSVRRAAALRARRKREVVVYDYVDSSVPVLARMAMRRQAGYRALGMRSAQLLLASSPSNAEIHRYSASYL